MNTVNVLFLQALSASLEKKTVDWKEELTPEQWNELFAAAAAHRVLPMIYEAVAGCPSARKADPQIFAEVKRQSIQLVMLQTRKSDAFLKLLQSLRCAGLTPLVVKGIICREQYPKPDYRISGDEDLLIPESQLAVCHETLLANGMMLMDPEWNMKAHEIPYIQKCGPLCIDLHRRLFPKDWKAYDEVNRIFDGVHQRAIIQTIQGVPVCTMDHTDHLLFLICHSFKHFIGCGMGVRQICDICLYANVFGSQIEWPRIMRQCEDIHADTFAAALFRIGEKYLAFQPETACYPDQWRMLELDERAMLEDIFDAGIYGKSSIGREHSRLLTMHAFSDQNNEQNRSSGILKTVFPSAKYLSGRYPYLERKPYLLPVAWVDRIIKYRAEAKVGGPGNDAADSVRIGRRRIELLKQYGIIKR